MGGASDKGIIVGQDVGEAVGDGDGVAVGSTSAWAVAMSNRLMTFQPPTKPARLNAARVIRARWVNLLRLGLEIMVVISFSNSLRYVVMKAIGLNDGRVGGKNEPFDTR